ncbi:MAG: zinc ribbon domain-containing protein [Chloroflexi bacterium]|nr:zinc ribbon domain-containing protein [Chloroflexota bacterium]MCI0578364.1 zinc ribbon domain-containing protein [Chloroflexota bacterium]MCI0646233.1 zinc ribbon domain-containing protein [Chloroflexota bacterium]MCI0732147.1 zinc ribbon domain-containing protein [Chloroflexota bacterium]
MPRYDFRCPDCQTVFEERRSFDEAHRPATCPVCGQPEARKVLLAVAVLSNGGQASAERIPVPMASHGCGCGSCSCGAH